MIALWKRGTPGILVNLTTGTHATLVGVSSSLPSFFFATITVLNVIRTRRCLVRISTPSVKDLTLSAYTSLKKSESSIEGPVMGGLALVALISFRSNQC